MPLPDYIQQFIDGNHFERPDAAPPDTAENIAQYPKDKRVEYIKNLLAQNTHLQEDLKEELKSKFDIALFLTRIEVQLGMSTNDSNSHQQFLALEHALVYVDQKGFETHVAVWTNLVQRQMTMLRICAIYDHIRDPEVEAAFNEIARLGSGDKISLERMVAGASIRNVLSLWEGNPVKPTGAELLGWIDDDLAMKLAGDDSEDPQDLIRGPESFLTKYFKGQLTEAFQASYARRLRRIQRHAHKASDGDGGRGRSRQPHTSTSKSKRDPSNHPFKSFFRGFTSVLRGNSSSRRLKEPPRRPSRKRTMTKHAQRPKSRATTRHKTSKGKEKAHADPSSSKRHTVSSSNHAAASSSRYPPSSSRRPPSPSSPQMETVVSVNCVPKPGSSLYQAIGQKSVSKGKEGARPPSPAPSVAPSVKSNVTVWPGPRPAQPAVAAARAAVGSRPDSTGNPWRREKKSSPTRRTSTRGRSPPPARPARTTSPLVSPNTTLAPPIPPTPAENHPTSRRSSWTTMRPPPDDTPVVPTPVVPTTTTPRPSRPQSSTLMAPTAASLRRQAEASSASSPTRRPSNPTVASLRTARTRPSSSSLRNSATVGLGIKDQPTDSPAAPPSDVPATTPASSRQPLDNPFNSDSGREIPQATPSLARQPLDETTPGAHQRIPRQPPASRIPSAPGSLRAETPVISRRRLRTALASPASTQADLLSQVASPETDARRRAAAAAAKSRMSGSFAAADGKA